MRSTWGLAALAVALTAGAVAAPAWGEEADALARARAMARAFEYDEGLELLQTIVEDPDASAADRLAALELSGVFLFNLRRQEDSRAAFERMLRLDPGHRVTDPSYPPRLREFFDTVAEGYEPEAPAALHVEAVVGIPSPGRLTITVDQAELPPGAARVLAMVRTSPSEIFEENVLLPMAGSATCEMELPARARGVDYFVEALAPSGHVVARAGSEEAPLRVSATADTDQAGGDLPPVVDDPDPTEGPAWYATWWFWTIVGVVVAGGTTTAVVLTLPEGPDEGSLGVMDLP